MRHGVLAVSAAALIAAACGDGGGGTSGGPAGPAGPEPVASVVVTAPVAELDTGTTVQLTAVVRSAAGAPLTGRAVSWSSGDEAVATVSQTGLVTGRTGGRVVIRATSEGRTGEAALRVNEPAPPAVASVEILPSGPVSLAEGRTAQLAAVTRAADGSVLDDRVVTWSSADAAVAGVSAGGLVTAVRGGETRITATSEGISAAVDVSVAESFAADLLFDADDHPRIYRLGLAAPGADAVPLLGAGSWDAAPSPDGTRLAFTCTTGHGTAICVTDRSGGGMQVLTSDSANEDQPSWSPDGTRIAFRRWPAGGSPGAFNPTRVWVMDADGSGQREITAAGGADGWQEDPAWSPDGQRIAFSHQTLSGGYVTGRIASVRTDGTDWKAITVGGDYLETEPAWAPDGATLVFVREGGTAAGDLWLVSAGGGSERPLMADDPADAQRSPAWSPDGRHVVFTSVHELAADNRWSRQIYAVRPDGTRLTRLTDRGGDRARPAWARR